MLLMALWTLGIGYLGIGLSLGIRYAKEERELVKKSGKAFKISKCLSDIGGIMFLWLPALICFFVVWALVVLNQHPDECKVGSISIGELPRRQR